MINRFDDGIDIAPSAEAGLTDTFVTNVRIEGNFIGTNPAGTRDRGNTSIGMSIFNMTNSTVGGSSLASPNLISGNDENGIDLFGSDNNKIQGNLIGTKWDGISALGNRLDGVVIHGNNSEGNRILSNAIFSNGEEGIDLGENGPTANDAGDADTGDNRLQNFPVLSSATTISGTTTIEGTLNSRLRELYTIQFFSSPSGDEGQTFIGQKVVSTDASGNATFSFSPSTAVAVGQQITATATRNSTGDTSEFSAAQEVTDS